MKKFFLILVLMLLGSGILSAQTIKFPGASATFSWGYLVADEPKVTGFRIYSGPNTEGPFLTLAGFVSSAQARQLSATVNFPSGSIKVFYVARAFFTGTSGTVESTDSNVVEVDMAVTMPTTLQVN